MTDESGMAKDDRPAGAAPAEAAAHDGAEGAAAAPPAASPEDDLAQPQPILLRLERLEQSLALVSTRVEHLVERADLLPRQLRQLGVRVDDITESISHPRINAMLMSLIMLHDLVEQMGQSAAAAGDSTQNYRVLRDQIAQMLTVNGVRQIETAERFDPARHKAIQMVACATPEEEGEIAQLYRAGFCTERSIVRYAEVVVKRYETPAGSA